MTTLPPSGFLTVGASHLEYRMIGPSPESAPTIVMLHEGLGSAGLWGDFPEKLQAATGAGVFVYSRAGYGASTPVKLPRPLDYMHFEALDVLPKLLAKIGFRRGLLLGHSDGASIAAIYARSRDRDISRIAKHRGRRSMRFRISQTRCCTPMTARRDGPRNALSPSVFLDPSLDPADPACGARLLGRFCPRSPNMKQNACFF